MHAGPRPLLALRRPLAFFDGPGGPSARRGDRRDRDVPARVEREHRRAVRDLQQTDELVELAHERAADVPRLLAGEVAFGPSMTASTSCSRERSRGRCEPGDEIVVTALDHDANVSPWLELAHDLDLVVASPA